MSIPTVPVDAKQLDWPRRVANAVNALIGKSVQRDGATIYTAPTISNPPTQAEVQAIADAVEAISARLK
ncbi:MAG: hypothetical protein J7500_15780 [Sphingomonas sp.]|uniref:hypothetical protein n=1 Tax=Sphingomonas sp. TaxID=28214 RepID=UPI001B086FBF|nr:hypothetical protein [Sphingomonas sp.]MBO9624168.1 hypothetical protein [Sphingomonas sp.]